MQAANKLGETIYKGHRSYDLMLNLQLGIRHSVQQVAKEPTLKQLSDYHFLQKVRCTPAITLNLQILAHLLCIDLAHT